MDLTSQTRTAGLRAEPNVIPFLDVLLALVVLAFLGQMLSRFSIPVETPPVRPAEPSRTYAHLILEVAADGGYLLNGQPVDPATLPSLLAQSLARRPVRAVFLRIAPARSYQEAIDAASLARGAGAEAVGFMPMGSPPALPACPGSPPVPPATCAR